MSDLQAHNQKVWDRLFDLLYPCDESITDAEVDADLQQAGIDMRPAFRRLHEMIEQKKARQQFARAGEVRASMMNKLRDVVSPKVGDLRTVQWPGASGALPQIGKSRDRRGFAVTHGRSHETRRAAPD
jgi:hypothetical protein